MYADGQQINVGEIMQPIHVTIKGDIGVLETESGDAPNNGNAGSISTKNGNVACGPVSGSVYTKSGNTHRR